MKNLHYIKSNNILLWDKLKFNAVAGGYGKGPLPSGKYIVQTRKVVVGSHLAAGFKDKLSGMSWFIPIEPNFLTSRSGFGIHPDGPPVGTKGCIGLTEGAAGAFWRKWMGTILNNRPTELIVDEHLI